MIALKQKKENNKQNSNFIADGNFTFIYTINLCSQLLNYSEREHLTARTSFTSPAK